MDQQPQYDTSGTTQAGPKQADQDRIVQWLGDAHAMEMDAQTMLKTFASRLEHYPALKQRVEQHVGETQRQAQRLEERLQALGSSTPTLRDAAASAMAALHATGNAMMSDEFIKGVGISYAFEHMEIASYRNLLFAAETVGDAATAQLCRDILPEEEAMARWLFEHQQDLVQQFLSLDAMPGVTAKH
jgi:ferritin-like metal-binding protein YciE